MDGLYNDTDVDEDAIEEPRDEVESVKVELIDVDRKSVV